jgi:ABC-type antimicrobial peptide transport system permease subunit
VLRQGAAIAFAGVVAGAGVGYLLAQLAGSYFQVVRMPGAVPLICSAGVLVAAALIASMMPAARAARVDVIQALRSE